MTEHAYPPAPDDRPLPWEMDAADTPADPSGPRPRHDAFTDARKCVFLRALKKTGCILDACRITGISAKTVYRHQESDRRFAEYCRIGRITVSRASSTVSRTRSRTSPSCM